MPCDASPTSSATATPMTPTAPKKYAVAVQPTAMARARCDRTRLASSRFDRATPSVGTMGPPHTPQRHRSTFERSTREAAPQWGQGLSGRASGATALIVGSALAHGWMMEVPGGGVKLKMSAVTGPLIVGLSKSKRFRFPWPSMIITRRTCEVPWST
jgi:hypothetical protein